MRIRTLTLLALLVVALFVAVALLYLTRTAAENRTYVIGWEVDPPDQVANKTGEPTGFAVELVREAARRSGIQLKWVEHPESSEAALRSKAVDLWPMMTITKERKQVIHLTDPYQEDEFGLFVDAKSAFATVGDLKHQTISYDGLPSNARLLREQFPGNVLLSKPSLLEAVRSVCAGEAQAFFEDHITVFSLLLSNPPCPGTPLRMIPTPPIKIQLGIGATRESGPAADAIREEISAMARDGSLERIVGVWSHAASQEVASLITLQKSKNHLRWYRIGFASVAALFLFAVWSAAGYRRQRIKAQAYARALGLAERNVRLVGDSLSEMVVAYDSDKKLIYANSGAEKLTGYGLAELQVAAPLSWTHPEDRPELQALWERVSGGQMVDQVVYRLIAKDGTVKWVAGSWGAVTDEAGRQVGIRGTCQDITERVAAERLVEETIQKFRPIVEEIAERKRVEQALLESEERTRLAMQAGRMFAFEWNPRTDEVRRSYNSADILGSEAEATREAGKESLKRVHPDDQERLRQAIRSLTPANDRYEIQYRVIRHGGQIATLQQNGRALFDNGAEMIRLIGIIADITERNQAETALRDSEERFRLTFSQAAVGMAHTGLGGEWLLLNDRFCEILGYSQAELRGKSFLDFTHPDDREASLTAVRRLLAAEIASWSTETRYVRKDGAILFVRLWVSLVRHQDNRPQYFISVVEDVTDKLRAELALRDSERRLTLAESAAHLGVWERDLRTNVKTISGECAKLYGLTPDRSVLTYAEWLSLIHPYDRERLMTLIADSIQRTGSWDTEFRVVWPDGSVHWLLTKGTVLLDDSGRPVRRVGVCLDITERKQAEAALRESEERFRNMADTAPVLIWVSGPDKLTTFFNKPWLDFTGRTLEQEMGDGWAAGVHPRDLDRCLETYSSSFDARCGYQMEYRIRRVDGEYRWLLENGIPRHREGEFIGFIGSCIDVTDHKVIEERLRANEVRLMEAQRLARIGSWELDIEDDRIHWSDEVFRIFGLPNGPPSTYSAVLSHVHPKDQEKLLESDRQVRSNILPVEVEYRIIRPQGEVRFVHSIVEAVRNDRGALIRIVGSIQDITEQVKARELLRESEERLKNAERLAHVGNWHWDMRTNRVSGSEEMFRIFGKPRNYIPNYEGFLEDLMPQDRERMEQLIRDSLATKNGHSIEYEITHPNGDLRTISCIWEVLVDEEGLPVRIFGTCQDITDSRRVQEESFARQQLETVGTLANGIAHDFNNLLGVVLAQADLALDELDAGSSFADSSLNEELQAIREVAVRGSEIVRQLMIYAGKEDEVVGLVDVSRVIQEMLKLLKVSVSKRATLKTDLGKDLQSVRANAAQLRQIVMNLVTNASEAIGDRDGVIRVTTGRVTQSRAAANSRNRVENDYLQLEVSDNGRGMSQEMQARVFDPFFTTKSAGHGLGLAVVHGIVRGLRGSSILPASRAKGRRLRYCCLVRKARLG